MPGSRRSFLRATIAGLAVWGLRVDPVEGMPEALPAGEALYRRSLVIDALGSLGSAGPGAEDAITEAMLAAAEASGVTALNQTVGPVGNRPELEAFARVVSEIAFWDRQVDRHPQRLRVVRRATDLGSDRQVGRLGLIFGLQDGVCFESDLDRLETLHELGLRIVQPTYNVRNLLGDGCMEPGDAGLSRQGRAAVERMNVPDLNTPRRLETLAGLLLARGHSTGTVEKVLGANFARLFTEAWA